MPEPRYEFGLEPVTSGLLGNELSDCRCVEFASWEGVIGLEAMVAELGGVVRGSTKVWARVGSTRRLSAQANAEVERRWVVIAYQTLLRVDMDELENSKQQSQSCTYNDGSEQDSK